MRNRMAAALGALILLAPNLAPPVRAEIIDRIVAVVNDEIITMSELQDVAAPVLRQVESIGDPVVRDQQREKQLRGQLDELIGSRLILQEAVKRKINVEQSEIDEHIAEVKGKQKWDDAQFELFLRGQGLTPAKFREQVREQLTQRKVVYLVLGNRIRVTDADLEEFHKEKMTLARTSYSIEAAHILLKVPDDSDTTTVAATKQKTSEILARIAAGEDFATLAKAYSEGPTASRGGHLGTFQKGTLDPEFEDVAFGLPDGGVGGPVRTRYGWHIIKVYKREALSQRPFEEAKNELRLELRNKRLTGEMKGWVDDLKQKSFVDVRL